MAKAKRIFEVAKQLDVTSKVIVEKCKAEGVPGITNHMSVVKIGLLMTIQEWFAQDQGQEAVVTAVETSKKIDLNKVKVPRRKAAKKKTAPIVEPKASTKQPESVAKVVAQDASPKDEAKVSPPVEQVAMVDKISEPETTESKAPTPLEKQPSKQDVASQEALSQSSKQASSDVGASASGEQSDNAPGKPLTSRAVGKINVPDRPKNIKPIGQKMVKPTQAILKGPKVIRVEAPEVIESRRPSRRSSSSPTSRRPSAEPVESRPEIIRSKGPVRGRGVGSKFGAETAARPTRRRGQNVRRSRGGDSMPIGPGKISEQDLIELDARLKGAPGYLKKRRRSMKKQGSMSHVPTLVETGGKVEIDEPITIKKLSSVTGIKSADTIKHLFAKGMMVTINSAIDTEIAMEIAMEYNIELEVKEQQTAEQQVIEAFEQRESVDVKRRPPVVAVLGHVDHGKTSLLDCIRQGDVAAHEAGGITQHIGAYKVTIKGNDDVDKTVVFLDTPGHEAFTSMRARGANVTDLIVLVIAADDGVMPQTIESINHAKAAGVPVIVALNKIDMPQATEENIQKVYGQLAEHGLNPTAWGGETEVIPTSAVKGTGIAELMEVLDYQAELLELKADYGGSARGVVIESEMQEGRGSVARILVQQGLLKLGDFVVSGRSFGRVRDMTDDRGRSVTQAGPATPLELSGIDLIPNAGDKFYITSTLKQAEDVAKHYRETERERQLANKSKVTLDNFSQKIKEGMTLDLRVVLKADVQGSIDVLRKTLSELGNDEVRVRVLHAAVGGVTESDVLLANASDAIVIGFHVVTPSVVRDIAEERHVDIRLYRVIYDVIDDVKKALEGMLTPQITEEQIGIADVREVFKISKVGNIAGCLVGEGSILRGNMMRLVRNDVVVTEDREIESLKRVKDDAKEVHVGTECGIRLVGFDDLKAGDQLICYKKVSVARTLD